MYVAVFNKKLAEKVYCNQLVPISRDEPILPAKFLEK